MHYTLMHKEIPVVDIELDDASGAITRVDDVHNAAHIDVYKRQAELMKHRDAADTKRYKVLSKKFIEKFGIDTSTYDVIKGWRANASYFYIAKEFVRDNVDTDILEELLSLGGLGIQYCIKSELAYSKLTENKEGLIRVEYSVFNDKYNQRDVRARENMHDLIESDANKVTNVFSTLF